MSWQYEFFALLGSARGRHQNLFQAIYFVINIISDIPVSLSKNRNIQSVKINLKEENFLSFAMFNLPNWLIYNVAFCWFFKIDLL